MSLSRGCVKLCKWPARTVKHVCEPLLEKKNAILELIERKILKDSLSGEDIMYN